MDDSSLSNGSRGQFMDQNHILMMLIDYIDLCLWLDGWKSVSDYDKGKNWCCGLLFHSINSKAIFWLLNNVNGSRNGENFWVWCDQFNDVDDSVIIKGGVFVKQINIFKKKTVIISVIIVVL